MSDANATQARQDVVAEVDEIIEHVINANMLSMPYHVYSELFDAVDRLGVEIENLQSQNAKLRELLEDMHAALQAFCDAQDVHGDNCPLWVERTDDCELRGIERRMRELGVDE